jgi:hypothetical protein
MLLRCAKGLVAGPVGLAAGLVFATGIAAGVAMGAGLAGAGLIGKRLWEERQGWRHGSGSDDHHPPMEPAPETPSA